MFKKVNTHKISSWNFMNYLKLFAGGIKKKGLLGFELQLYCYAKVLLLTKRPQLRHIL